MPPDTTTSARVSPSRPPAPRDALSLLAFLRAIRTNALSIWPQAAYRDDIAARSFFGRMNVLVNAPEAIHRVLIDNAANYRRSPATIRILRPIAGEGLLLSEGETWRHQRRIIAPALSPRVMPILARHIVETTLAHAERLAKQAHEGPVNLLGFVQDLALEIAGRSLFSLEMHAFGGDIRGLLTEYAHRLARPHLFDMLLPPSVPTMRDLQRRQFQRRWMHLIEAIIGDRLRQSVSDDARDLFDLLRAARDPDSGERFSAEQLRDQLSTMLLAGHETTAITLFWSLTLLAMDPMEQQRVAEEVRGVTITPDDATAALPVLVRTRAVINETLRLYPPAFAIVREAIGPDRWDGFELPRHAVVMISPWVLHRHQRYWRHPDAFDPGRFMPDSPPPPRFAFLPFGAGPRVCVGAQFALTEAVLVLAMLVQRFAFSLEAPRPVLPVAAVTTQPDHAPMFRVQSRSHEPPLPR